VIAAIRTVVVVAPNWLGDAVMALPALTDVRRHFTGARLVVAARHRVAPLFGMVSGVDEVVTLAWGGTVRARAAWRRDVGALRSMAAGAVVLLPNSFSSAWLARAARIPERWGYARGGRSWLLTRAVTPPGRSVHQAEYYQHLVRQLGIETGPREAVVDVPAGAIDAARALLFTRGWDGQRPLVVMAPGAAYGTAKQWPPQHFARLAGELVSRDGATCALVGSAGDAEATASICRAAEACARAHVLDLAGATSLDTLAGVLALARACVSNDSGAMHLAAAVGTPLVALFGPTREYETAPLARRRAEVLINHVWCRPCMLRDCPIDHRCMTGLTPERVGAAVRELMET
jgi:heptosyltransferase-2